MQFDAIIKGGHVIDGTGTRGPSTADVGIVGDRIVAVGSLERAQARQVIDATGRMVCPGFIDVHVHSEIALLGGRDQFSGLRQGITTQLTSPDGLGWAPLPPQTAKEMWRYTRFAYREAGLSLDWPTVEDYLDVFTDRVPINVYPQIPHCAVRLRAMGWESRPATDRELDHMKETVEEWMEAGASGMCLGLDYQPSAYSDMRELVALSELIASYGGVYAAHIRTQILGRRGAWEETIEIARRAGIPVHISHERVDQEAHELLQQVDRDGIDLTFESYLYPAGMTHLAYMLPVEVQAGSMDNMLHRMQEPHIRAKCLPYLREKFARYQSPVIGYTKSGRFIAMTLSQAADSVGQPLSEFAYDLILQEDGVTTLVFPWPNPREESERIIAQTTVHPRMMIASDGVYDIPHPHPRGYGCFVRVLRRFVRELGLLTWEEAVHKMSGFPASRFGLKDRGRIAEGMAADIVVFDPATIADRATWDEPMQAPVGVEWVVVNGEIAIENGAPTGRLPGRVVRRSV